MKYRYPSDAEIFDLWSQKKNTNEIARALWCPEFVIASRLPAILAKARQDHEWNFDRTA